MAKKEKTVEEQVEELKNDALKKLRSQAKKAVAAQRSVIEKQGIKNGDIPFEITEEILGNADALSEVKEYYLDQRKVALAHSSQVKGFHPLIKRNYNDIASKCQVVADCTDNMIKVITDFEKAVNAINNTLENEEPTQEEQEEQNEENKQEQQEVQGEQEEQQRENEQTDGNSGDTNSGNSGEEEVVKPKKPRKRAPKKTEQENNQDEQEVQGEQEEQQRENEQTDGNSDDTNSGNNGDEEVVKPKKPRKRAPKKTEQENNQEQQDDQNNDDTNNGDGQGQEEQEEQENNDQNNGDNQEQEVQDEQEEQRENDQEQNEQDEQQVQSEQDQNNDQTDTQNGGNSNKPKAPNLFKGIDEKYYKNIFKVINTTVVLGSKDKYNTLENLEYVLSNGDVSKLQELGFPIIKDPEKAELIRKVLLKFVKVSKEIRKDQWLSSLNENKKGSFEARKHTTEEAIIDRNERLIKRLRISKKVAREYGLSLSQEDLNKTQNNQRRNARRAISKSKEDESFIAFYNQIKEIYKLGEASGNSISTLNSIYNDLVSGKNTYGLEGDALKAGIKLVEREIVVRRNTYKSGKTASNKAIGKERKSLGLAESEQGQEQEK